jgi:hypothetical protein
VNIVVTGPASSGTRFVSMWLDAHPEVVARHWSMPSGEGWMKHWPTDHDFDGERPDRMVFVQRSLYPTVQSQLARGMVEFAAQAEAEITQAHLRAYAWATAHGIPVFPLLYDAVIDHPERFDDIFRWLDLQPVDGPWPIVDENSKWYLT